MKIVIASNGKRSIKMSKQEWQQIGSKAGWMKESGLLEDYKKEEEFHKYNLNLAKTDPLEFLANFKSLGLEKHLIQIKRFDRIGLLLRTATESLLKKMNEDPFFANKIFSEFIYDELPERVQIEIQKVYGKNIEKFKNKPLDQNKIKPLTFDQILPDPEDLSMLGDIKYNSDNMLAVITKEVDVIREESGERIKEKLPIGWKMRGFVEGIEKNFILFSTNSRDEISYIIPRNSVEIHQIEK